jgi:flagellar hook assembly protein FlgD
VELTSLSDQVLLPTRYRLYPAFPNPFNPSTRVRFDIPDNEGSSVKASLVIYNTLGQIVKTIFQGYSETGSYEFLWLGDNEKGDIVPNGIYYVMLKTEKYQQSRKLILMK